jgi:hypothetical protein
MPTNHDLSICCRVRVARTNLAGTRRRVIVAVADPASAIAFTSASAEVVASLGALAAISLSLGGLGMVIRQANAEAPAVTPKTFAAAATPAPGEAATTPGVVATSVTSTAAVVEEDEKGVAIKTSEFDFSGAAAAASEARNWIQSWRDRSVAAAAAAAASEAVLAVASSEEEEVEPPVTSSASSFPAATTTITTSSRVTEPTLQQLFSVSAAAELADMAADAPVGITSPAATPLVKQQQKEEEHVMVAAGIPAAAPTTDLATDRENQYKAKLARIYTDSKEEYQRSHTAVQAAAAAAKGMKKGVVVIAEEYDHKVQAMWSAFATKKQQEAQLVAKQEKILMDLSELDRVQKKAKLNEGVQKKMISVGAQIAAFFQQMFAMMMQELMTLLARIMGNSNGNGPKPSAA